MDDLIFAIDTINKIPENNLALEIYYSKDLHFCVKIFDLRHSVSHSIIIYTHDENLNVACRKAMIKINKKLLKGEFVK